MNSRALTVGIQLVGIVCYRTIVGVIVDSIVVHVQVAQVASVKIFISKE